MASRAKKKQAERPIEERKPSPVVVENKSSKPQVWVWIMLAAIIAAIAFSFVPSYDVQATVDLDLGDSDTQLFEDDDFHIGAAVLDILFAPVGGYDGAADWLVRNFPATEDNETMQSIASSYMESYPPQLLAQLDSAFVAIFAIEVAIVVVTVLYIVGFLVLVSTKCTFKHLAAIVLTAVATLVSLVRMIFAITVYSQSTAEFVLNAGGGSWLTFVAFAAALAVLVATYISKRTKEKASR